MPGHSNVVETGVLTFARNLMHDLCLLELAVPGDALKKNVHLFHKMAHIAMQRSYCVHSVTNPGHGVNNFQHWGCEQRAHGPCHFWQQLSTAPKLGTSSVCICAVHHAEYHEPQVNETNHSALRMMTDNKIGAEGAKALGPHLAKLNNMTTLNLGGA